MAPTHTAEPRRTTELTAGQVEAVKELAQVVQDHDGLAAFDENTLLTLGRPGRPRFLISAGGGGLAGFAQASDGSAEVAVHPGHRRRGLGTSLVRAVLADHPRVRLWAHGNLPGAQAIAAAQGLEIVREMWVMARRPPTREDVPEVAVPGDLRVRTFEVGADEEAWLTVNARAFAEHPEQGRLEIADLRARQEQDWFDPETFWLAEDAATGALLGYMWVKITGAAGADREGPVGADDGAAAGAATGAAAGTGEIYVLGVDPSAQGRGIGGLLTAVAMRDFAKRDLARLELYVEADNTAAIATYRRAGFERDVVHVQYTAPTSPDREEGATIGA
ncbi:MAG TPA: mycothiol synthase [Beutenbergiaceae bacterium]|nr:mycothiol synthase [Beutenbergiaceae bacterium]